MAADEPLVSVILPVYNGSQYIADTVESVLRQTYRNLELIVVDDGSTDGTLAVVEKFAPDARLRVISQPNSGVARARNRGLETARGEFIAPLDADDLWDPRKIELQVRRMQECGPATGLVYCWWVWIDSEGRVLDRSPHWRIEGDGLARLIEINYTGNASVPLYRRSCLAKIGGYDEGLEAQQGGGCEDWDVSLKVAETHRVAVVPALLVGYRRRAGSMSTQSGEMRRSSGLVMNALRHRRPDLAPQVFRQSSDQFSLYLAGVSFWSGAYVRAAGHALRALRSGLLFRVVPHVLRLLWRRAAHTAQTMQKVRPGEPIDASLVAEPLIPYDRIYSSMHAARSRRRPDSGSAPRLLERLLPRTVTIQAARLLHAAMLWRMRTEAWLARLAGSRKPRILATACWHFPIYSQTFVYRELTELARAGFTLRFSYTGPRPRRELGPEYSILWPLRRRLILTDRTSNDDLAYYRRRVPDRVEAAARALAVASGLTAAQVLEHRHFRHAMSFTRMADCWRADYLHSYFFYERTLFAFVASMLLEIPRGVSCYADHMLDDYALKLIPLHMRTAQVVVATSARIRRELETIAGQTLANAIVKPNAVDTSQFTPERRAQSGGPLNIVCVSRIHPKKGIIHLADAMGCLGRRGVAATLHVLGAADEGDSESAEYQRLLQARIAELGPACDIRLDGWKTGEEVRQYLAAADVFTAPFIELPNGDKDGIPTALLEAMASGCAIVTSDAGSITEVIENGVEGLVVPQSDPAALADAIERLANDGALRARLSRGAVERVRREFDIGRCESLFHGSVRAAIEQKRSPAFREAVAQ